MRAIVLMRLLCAACATSFSWDGFDGTIQDPMPSTDSACMTDQGGCGCCLMLQEVNRLRTHFNTSLNELEKEYLRTKQSLNNIEASYTAISVALFNKFQCYGPFLSDTLITYKHVFINLGDSYSPQTGIFTVPHSGVYSLAVTVYSDAGSADIMLNACAALLVNNKVVVSSKDRNLYDHEDSATIAVAYSLSAGDQVAVLLPAGCFLCDDSNHYNTFSAFLLYPAE